MPETDFERCPLDMGGDKIKSPVPENRRIPVKQIIAQLDALYSRERNADGSLLLTRWLARARAVGDWSGELSMLSELMGHYRRTGEKQKGLSAVEDGLKIIREQGVENTVSAATVMLNAATTLKAFGEPERSISIFTAACRVYSNKLDPNDYRFSGLYNNMALTLCDLGRLDEAEDYYRRALSILSHCGGNLNERAVTYCNLCELYSLRDPEDPKIAECAETAYKLLCDPSIERDGYHAFTISKCAPTLEKFGFVNYAKELKNRAEAIYERA